MTAFAINLRQPSSTYSRFLTQCSGFGFRTGVTKGEVARRNADRAGEHTGSKNGYQWSPYRNRQDR